MQDIDLLRKDLFEKRFYNELEFMKEKELELSENNEASEDNWVLERINHLEKIISSFKKAETQKEEKENIINDLDQYIYKKQWHHLPEFHKMTKIKEFLDENIKDEKIRKNIIDEMNELIYNKKLNSKKYVDYNPSVGKIQSIKALDYNEETGTFNIKQ